MIDDNSVDSPVIVKTTKACIEKVKINKRTLNLSVEIVMDNKKKETEFLYSWQRCKICKLVKSTLINI